MEKDEKSLSNWKTNVLRCFCKKPSKLLIIFFFIFILGSYLLGVLFPFKPIRPHLVNKDITINEILTRLFQLLAAVATFISVFVALFRDELRRKFLEIHEVHVDFVEDEKLSEYTLNEEGETDEKKVVKYLCEIEFKNLGNVHEKGCEIYIQNISTINQISKKSIKRSYSLLQWDNTKQTKILIPIKGKVYLTAFTITPPQEIKEDDSDLNVKKRCVKKLPSALKITDNVEFSANDISNVEVRIEYLLCFENNQPKEFNLVIKWDGTWANRIPEMKDKISIKLEFPENV